MPTPAQARTVRDFLQRHQYTQAQLQEALHTIDPPLPRGKNHQRFLTKLEGATPFQILAKLFFLGDSVAQATAQAALEPTVLALLTELQLIEVRQDRIDPLLLIIPYQDLYIATDRYQNQAEQAHYNHVLSPNPTARHLLDFTIRSPCETLLDLGTGCGIQALAAAQHASQVVATDLNERATFFATFNAALNEITTIETRTGNLFEPVQGEQFDRIVSNPPFILAPTKRNHYGDNDLELDSFCRLMVKQIPTYLKPLGIAQMICEWVEIEAEPWQQRITEWQQDTNCDLWCIKANTQTPEHYAQFRIREVTEQTGADAGQALAQWMDYYHQHRVTAIHGGLIVLRKRETNQWLRFDELDGQIDAAFGNEIATSLQRFDFCIENLDPSTLLTAKLVLAPATRLHQTLTRNQQQWQIQQVELASTNCLTKDIRIEQQIADFLVTFDGVHTVDQLIQNFSQTIGQPRSVIQAECMKMVQYMLERGYLEP